MTVAPIGQTLDPTTDLMYYGARYYDPLLGRFISADTIVPSPADPQQLNRYSYASNNPVLYTDPTGHCSVAGQQTYAGPCLQLGMAPYDYNLDYGSLTSETGYCVNCDRFWL